MSAERDTKFQGFAKLVVQELLGLRYQTVYYNDPQMLENYQQIIAQRAYDLACHVLYETSYGMDKWNIVDRVNGTPDLTAWPE